MTKEDDDMSLEALEVKPAKMKAVPRGKPAKPNPMTKNVQQSWDQKRAFSVEVPAGRAVSVGAMIRKAAMKVGLGVSVQYHLLPEDEYRSENAVKDMRENDPKHMVRVAYEAHELDKAARREDDDDE